MPIIGQYQISDIARVSYILHERWGRIVRLGGLLGRPDLLFVYDADEIEKVCPSCMFVWYAFPIARMRTMHTKNQGLVHCKRKRKKKL